MLWVTFQQQRQAWEMSKASQLSVTDPLIYSQTERTTAIVLTLDCSFGVVCDLVIIYALIGSSQSLSAWTHRIRSMSSSTRFLLLLLLGDLLFVTTQTIVGSMALVTNGYNLGPWGCVWDMVFTIMGQCMAVLSLCAVALDRYLNVRWQKQLSNRQSIISCVGITVASILLPTIAFLAPADHVLETVGLDSAKFVCTISWFDKSPLSIMAISLVLFVLFTAIIIIFFCYTAITLYFIHVYRERAKYANSNITDSEGFQLNTRSRKNSHKKQHFKYDEKEKKLIFKSMALTLCFLICFGPYVFKILYEVFTSEPLEIIADFVCHFFIGFYSFVNAILLIFLDNRVKQNVFALFRRQAVADNQSQRDGSTIKQPKSGAKLYSRPQKIQTTVESEPCSPSEVFPQSDPSSPTEEFLMSKKIQKTTESGPYLPTDQFSNDNSLDQIQQIDDGTQEELTVEWQSCQFPINQTQSLNNDTQEDLRMQLVENK